MKIWIFNQYAHPPDLPGGTRHYDLGRELVRRGHEVVIFASSFHHYLHRETRLLPGEKWKLEDFKNVKFAWVRTSPYERNDWRRVWNMVVFMLRVGWLGLKLPKCAPEIGRPDVIIGSSPHLLTPLAAYWVARWFRVPFVIEVRDLWPQIIIDMGGLPPHHPIIKALQALERFLYHRASCVIVLLPFAHKYISAQGVPRTKIIWLPNGVDLRRFGGTPTLQGGHRGFRVMYLGAHGQANALDVVVHAAKHVQDLGFHEIQFLLVGDGPEKPKLMSLAQELELRNIEFREPIPKTEVPELLKEADALLLQPGGAEIYRWGISSNKLYDFMAAGKPILSPATAPHNPVEEARCGLTIPPKDPQALAEAVIRLFQMAPEERVAMGRRGREYVEKYHDIKNLAAQMERVLYAIALRKERSGVHEA